MRAQDNPYTPNAGARPPALVGRDEELQAFEVLLARLLRGHTEQSMLVTGLRGVGKTVLLTRFEELAREGGWTTVEAEITKNSDFGDRMANLARRALLQLAPRARWKERAMRAAAVLRSFQVTLRSDGSVTAGFDVDPAEGLADSGQLDEDLTDVFVALGEAAQEHGSGVVFLIDEVQFLAAPEFEALIAAIHKTVQRQLPITLVGAGLPQLPRLAGEAKSYAERLFKFPRIGRLSDQQARAALVEPAKRLGVDFELGRAGRGGRIHRGLSLFPPGVRERAVEPDRRVTRDVADVALAEATVEAKLDGGFFRVRVERTTELEQRYLRAMAELGPEPQRAKDVAALLGRTSEQLAPTRARLIEKGLLYTPGRGLAAFTVPQFDRFMRRTYAAPISSAA